MSTQVISSGPKYRQVKEAIVAEIRSGRYERDNRLPSIREMMQLHNASYVTITRALGDLRETGLIEHRWGKGIFLKKEEQKAVRNIAVTFNGIFRATEPRMVQIFKGIANGFASTDWHMQLYPLPDTAIFGGSQHSLLASLLHEKRIDGLISLSPHPPEDIERLQEMCIPVINISNHYPSSATGCVMLDVADAARQIIGYLVDEMNRSRIHLVLGPRYPYSARLVRTSTAFGQALVHELRDRGITCPSGSIFYGDYEWQTLEPVVRQWFSSKHPPEAIVLADQLLPDYVFNFASEMGLKVPADLALVGLGPALSPPNIKGSRLMMPLEQMGAQAVAMLQRVVAGEAPQVERLPGQLIVEDSPAISSRPTANPEGTV